MWALERDGFIVWTEKLLPIASIMQQLVAEKSKETMKSLSWIMIGLHFGNLVDAYANSLSKIREYPDKMQLRLHWYSRNMSSLLV